MNENQVAVFKKKDGKLSVGRVLSDSEVASFFPDFDATPFLAIEWLVDLFTGQVVSAYFDEMTFLGNADLFFGDDMDNMTCMTCVHFQKVNKLRPNVQGYKNVSACVKYPDHYIFSDHMTSPETHFCSEHKTKTPSSSRPVLNPRTLLLRGEDLVNPLDKDPKTSSFRVPMREIELADLVFFQQEIGDALVCLKNRFTSFSIQ